ncbi:MAG TPA: hypothetical protein VE569_04700, partial [Acidimicrobiia bacterium]|nr:hypothetical protein [Acidimicrobiia bacterium]
MQSHWAVRRERGRSQGRKGPLKYEHDLPDRTLATACGIPVVLVRRDTYSSSSRCNTSIGL